MEELKLKIRDKEIQIASIKEKHRVITSKLNSELKELKTELKTELYSRCKHKCSGIYDNEICQDEHCECPSWHLLDDGTRINLDEVLNDISKVVGSDVRDKLKNMSGLLYGLPKHDNLFYVIVCIYNNTVPLWFAKKYTDIEPNVCNKHIEDFLKN